MLAKLEHSDEGVRQAAVVTLGKLEPAELAKHKAALQKVALEDSSLGVRKAAADLTSLIPGA